MHTYIARHSMDSTSPFGIEIKWKWTRCVSTVCDKTFQWDRVQKLDVFSAFASKFGSPHLHCVCVWGGGVTVNYGRTWHTSMCSECTLLFKKLGFSIVVMVLSYSNVNMQYNRYLRPCTQYFTLVCLSVYLLVLLGIEVRSCFISLISFYIWRSQ